MKEVELPDGTVVEFPAEMSNQEIEAVLAAQMGRTPQQPAQTLNPYVRALGRTGRNIAGAVTGALDVVNLPVKAASTGLGYLTGSEALKDYGMSPGIRDYTLGAIDRATGNVLQPTGPLEQAVDFVSEMAVPLGAAKVSTQADRITDLGKMILNPAGTAETIAGRSLPATLQAPQKVVTPSFKDVKQAASRSYQQADNLGGVVRPEGSNRFINRMLESVEGENERLGRVFESGPVNKIMDNIRREYAGKPMTLKDIEALDQRLTKEASRYFSKIDGAAPEYGDIKAIQAALRDVVEESADNPALIEGSTEGIEAYRRGAMLYARAKRLEEVDDIVQKALGQEQPARALRRGFNRLRQQKGYNRFTEQERQIIDTIAEEDLSSDAMKLLTSRLGAVVGLGSGQPLVGGALAATSAGARKLEKAGQLSKVNKLQREIVKDTGLVKKITPKDARILDRRGILNVLLNQTSRDFTEQEEE